MLKKLFKSNEEIEVDEELQREEEERRKKLKKFLRKATFEEFKNPGTYRTIIRVRDIHEGNIDINSSSDVEKWINRVLYNRFQIMNIHCQSNKDGITEYIITYWEVVPPKDWENRIQ